MLDATRRRMFLSRGGEGQEVNAGGLQHRDGRGDSRTTVCVGEHRQAACLWPCTTASMAREKRRLDLRVASARTRTAVLLQVLPGECPLSLQEIKKTDRKKDKLGKKE
jgi:hypothetical protein